MTRRSPDDIRAALPGPVNSIPTPFCEDGALDWDGVANIVEMGIEAGSRAVMLTGGDSQLMLLAAEEIVELTRFVAERVHGRCLTISATGPCGTMQAVRFAERFRDFGADVVMTLPPPSAPDPAAVEHQVRALARLMPVMLVGALPQGLLDRLADAAEVCCFKEDGTEAGAILAAQRLGHRYTIVTGGQLRRHVCQWPFGVRSYMDWSASVAPAVCRRFWRASQHGDIASMAEVVREVETPFQAVGGNQFYGDNSGAGGGAFPGGWQGVWRAALEINGVSRRFLRPPNPKPSAADMESLAAVMGRIGLRVMH